MHTQHPQSVFLIRAKMKDTLGFTIREHWIPQVADTGKYMYHPPTICLDFYNEPKRTMFLLKYSEYLI